MALSNENEKKQNYTDIQDYNETEAEQHFRVISPGRMVAKRFFKGKRPSVIIDYIDLYSSSWTVIVDATVERNRSVQEVLQIWLHANLSAGCNIQYY